MSQLYIAFVMISFLNLTLFVIILHIIQSVLYYHLRNVKVSLG